ncbi:hypothetical protein D3C80_1750400 [compost metagenome]
MAIGRLQRLRQIIERQGNLAFRRAGFDTAVWPDRAVGGEQHTSAFGGPGKGLPNLRQAGINDAAHGLCPRGD